MPSQNIFCNAPWYELQIYWDGSLGFCCQESHKIYPEQESGRYNVRDMTIKQWFDSAPMRRARLAMFGDSKNSICRKCYWEEQHSSSSRRHKSNQKSVIFTQGAFQDSYLQSPGHSKFEHSRLNGGQYDGMPIDLHIDLGNYCNLACKMCRPEASSVIASQYVKWGIKQAKQYVGTDWTRDDKVWTRVLNELAEIPNLKNIHFMGGETLITRRFEDFVDFMLSKNRTDINFSFVTNGTVFNQSLLDKLKCFQRIGIEVSVETLDSRNSYQRQGTDNALVMSNIAKYLDYCDGSSRTLTLRPAISALTIGGYHQLLEYALQNHLVIKGNIVSTPKYLEIAILPLDIRKSYLARYTALISKHDLNQAVGGIDYNESDPNKIKLIIRNQVDLCMNLLSAERPKDSDQRLAEMVAWCRRWDDVYGLDALQTYPELSTLFRSFGYA